MARLDAGLLETAGRRIEAGMEHGAIGLAGAREDVGRAFQKHCLETAEGEAPEEGAADHAATDDGEVEGHEKISLDRVAPLTPALSPLRGARGSKMKGGGGSDLHPQMKRLRPRQMLVSSSSSSSSSSTMNQVPVSIWSPMRIAAFSSLVQMAPVSP